VHRSSAMMPTVHVSVMHTSIGSTANSAKRMRASWGAGEQPNPRPSHTPSERSVGAIRTATAYPRIPTSTTTRAVSTAERRRVETAMPSVCPAPDQPVAPSAKLVSTTGQLTPGSPDALDPLQTLEHRVRADQRESTTDRLRADHPVEGIPVVP